MSIEPEGAILFHNENAELSGIFSQSFHWVRKDTLLSVLSGNDDCYAITLAYHYQRIFGYEFEPGEILFHPDDGGCLFEVTRKFGLSKFREAALYRPSYDELESKYWFQDTYETDSYFQKCKKIHFARKSKIWKESRDVTIYSVEHPIVEYLGMNRTYDNIHSFKLHKYWTKQFNLTSKTTLSEYHGLDKNSAECAMLEFSQFPDPLRTKKEGARLISSFHLPSITQEDMEYLDEIYSRDMMIPRLIKSISVKEELKCSKIDLNCIEDQIFNGLSLSVMPFCELENLLEVQENEILIPILTEDEEEDYEGDLGEITDDISYILDEGDDSEEFSDTEDSM
jgi:hypothetical protein